MANAPELSLRGPSGAVAISGRQLRFRRECPVIHPGPARLHPKGTSSRCALRAPRRFAPRNDKLGGHCLFNIGPHFPPVRRREGTARPLQRAVDGPSKCKKPGMPDFPASPIGSLTYRTVPWRGRGGRPRSGSSAAPRDPRCRWSRRRSCRRSYPHRRAPWQPRSACRASAP